MSHNNETKKIKKVPKRFMSSIHVFKKSFLYKNDTNFDKSLYKPEQFEINIDLPKIELP
jgi:hypothetical protein